MHSLDVKIDLYQPVSKLRGISNMFRISRTAAASADDRCTTRTRTSIHNIYEYDFLMMMSIL